MTVPDYNSYMDVQQLVNLELLRRFATEGIEFAYPTRHLYLESVGAESSFAARSIAQPAADSVDGPGDDK
jgi:small-conductance mechanosensitive channel